MSSKKPHNGIETDNIIPSQMRGGKVRRVSSGNYAGKYAVATNQKKAASDNETRNWVPHGQLDLSDKAEEQPNNQVAVSVEEEPYNAAKGSVAQVPRMDVISISGQIIDPNEYAVVEDEDRNYVEDGKFFYTKSALNENVTCCICDYFFSVRNAERLTDVERGEIDVHYSFWHNNLPCSHRVPEMCFKKVSFRETKFSADLIKEKDPCVLHVSVLDHLVYLLNKARLKFPFAALPTRVMPLQDQVKPGNEDNGLNAWEALFNWIEKENEVIEEVNMKEDASQQQDPESILDCILMVIARRINFAIETSENYSTKSPCKYNRTRLPRLTEVSEFGFSLTEKMLINGRLTSQDNLKYHRTDFDFSKSDPVWTHTKIIESRPFKDIDDLFRRQTGFWLNRALTVLMRKSIKPGLVGYAAESPIALKHIFEAVDLVFVYAEAFIAFYRNPETALLANLRMLNGGEQASWWEKRGETEQRFEFETAASLFYGDAATTLASANV